MRKLTERFNALRRKHRKNALYAAEGMLIDVTEQIAHLLDARHMTRADLAHALGCSKAYVTKLLAGNQNLTLESLVRLAIPLKARLHIRLVPIAPRTSRRLKIDEPLKRITMDQHVLVGKPVIRGMRISVQQILGLLGKGLTPEDILHEFPVLEEEDIRAALLYASRVVSQGNAFQLRQTG